MSDPFRIDGPAVVSFSGGRTSAYMLRRILDAHGGALPADVHVLFADTGKERRETYEFVASVALRWGVHLDVVQYERHWRAIEPGGNPPGEAHLGPIASLIESDPRQWGRYPRFNDAPDCTFVPTPFEQLIEAKRYLPNAVTRFCTQELKVLRIRDWMRARGYTEWLNVVGLRADEEKRVARMRAPDRARSDEWESVMPLADAGITKRHVDAYWAAQSWGLHLKSHEGNCDLCFLKGVRKREAIMREHPDLARWWIEQEFVPEPPPPSRYAWSVVRVAKRMTFVNHAPPYSALAARIVAQGELPFGDDPTDLGDCACTD